MATADSIPNLTPSAARAATGLLVVLTAMPSEPVETLLSNLAATFPADQMTIATPDPLLAEQHPELRFLTVNPTNSTWTLTAADFINAHQLAQKSEARAVLILGPAADTLAPAALQALAAAVDSADLAIPCYDQPPRAGLVNAAILYPLTRALFATRARFPLALDLGLSLRMAERLAAAGQRFSTLSQSDALLWPIDEAAAAGFTIQEIDAGPRTLPQPTEADLNAVLALVTSSLFADIDAKAAFWQRARPCPLPVTPSRRLPTTTPPPT
ncbi:hypothetical protein FTO74_13605 [Granulicella sp. WH15]|uniref:hypothetical protein n=1 Tax=Granulicella sp. WH15 TaxID=2602070 RepID=UPI0013672783|nr:hypothetical protein [Granulicella sp. WH15]QHN04282.1 hypothetical protein FTO74_13605 [Granulicella sp. WH15]